MYILQYNTNRKPLIIPEYGRHIHIMVKQIMEKKEKDEDVDGKNLGYLDGEDLNTDVEGYNAKLVRVLHQESDVIDRRIV